MSTIPLLAFDLKSIWPSDKKAAMASLSFPYSFDLIFYSSFIMRRVLIWASLIAKFLLSLYMLSFSNILIGVAVRLNVFRHFCTSELMKILVSADFFISFSRTIYISVSICLPNAMMSSLRQINAFLDTLDLRLSIRASKSKMITCRFVDDVEITSSGLNSIILLSLLVD